MSVKCQKVSDFSDGISKYVTHHITSDNQIFTYVLGLLMRDKPISLSSNLGLKLQLKRNKLLLKQG